MSDVVENLTIKFICEKTLSNSLEQSCNYFYHILQIMETNLKGLHST